MNPWSNQLRAVERWGEIEQIIGLKIVAHGPPQVFVGELCDILDRDNQCIMQAEVIGFNEGKVYLLPFAREAVCMGYKVRASGQTIGIKASNDLLGTVVDSFALPFDHRVRYSQSDFPLTRKNINPLLRKPVTERLSTGIHALDVLLPLGKGQRIGIFAGSGVGKSVLLNRIAKQVHSDINIIALIGERGREVTDFIAAMDEQTRNKSIVVVACSDEFALKRRQAVYTATALAEYFCQQGKQVMLMMDSITRFAMAQREIGLSLGEPPTARGYTPSVFALLPELVERAGNFYHQGSITAIYTVLVEGDDFNEPIADTMRSLLDGHIILSRQLAHRGHYPAIDILQSISRLTDKLVDSTHGELIKKVRDIFNIYQQNKELIELGAYKAGTQASVDYAIERISALQGMLTQSREESLAFDLLMQRIQDILL